jgi:integrase
MSDVKYSLRNNTIQLVFSYGRKKLFRVSTGFKVNHSSNWNEGKQKIKEVANEPTAYNYNQNLNRLKNDFEFQYSLLLTKEEEINNTDLKEIYTKLNSSAQNVVKKASLKFIDLFEVWMDYSRHNRKKGKKLKESTIKTYKNSLFVFKQFEKSNGEIRFKNIDANFYNDFLAFCDNPSYRDEGFSMNYTGKVIKNLKSFLGYVISQHDVEMSSKFQLSDFTVISEEVDSIYLSTEELMKMYYLPLDNIEKRYGIARDLFLIGAWTGLRVSDFNRLEKEHLIKKDEVWLIKIVVQKTQVVKFHPVPPIVLEIIERRGGLPPKMAEQKINVTIKEIGEFCGFDEKVTIKKTIGGASTTKTMMKFDLIKSHTARRSFCTNAYLGGIDTITIMALSGHKSERNFLKYVKVTPIQHAVRFADLPYLKELKSSNYNVNGQLIEKE